MGLNLLRLLGTVEVSKDSSFVFRPNFDIELFWKGRPFGTKVGLGQVKTKEGILN